MAAWQVALFPIGIGGLTCGIMAFAAVRARRGLRSGRYVYRARRISD